MPSETKPERRTQRQRSEATTRDLLEAAREMFARDGYGATSLEAVAAEANVTKGALYHHFAGKRELFEAVFEEGERRLCAALADVHAKHADPVEAAYQGCRAFLDASLDPAARLELIDDSWTYVPEDRPERLAELIGEFAAGE